MVEFEKKVFFSKINILKVEMKRLERGIPSYGFRCDRKRINQANQKADRLKELGIPFGPLFGKLKRGEPLL